MIGVFLVYLQHNFEDTYWDRRPDLEPASRGFAGVFLRLISAGSLIMISRKCITLHDIHHFNARIPSYRLRAVPLQPAARTTHRAGIKFPEAFRGT